MEEPKKVLRAQYLGSTEVHVAVGMNTINDAVEKVISETNAENWPMVNVSISPSMIAVRPTGVNFCHSIQWSIENKSLIISNYFAGR